MQRMNAMSARGAHVAPLRSDEKAELREAKRRYVAEVSEIKRRHAHKKFCNLVLGNLRKLYRARGLSRDEIKSTVAGFGDLRDWSPKSLGAAVQLTADEKIKLDLRFIECAAAEDQERARIHFAAKRRERSKARKRKQREAKRKVKSLSARPAIVWEVLKSEPGGISAPELCRLVARRAAFRGGDTGRVRKAVERAIKTLEKTGLAQVERRPGKYRGDVLWVALKFERINHLSWDTCVAATKMRPPH